MPAPIKIINDYFLSSGSGALIQTDPDLVGLASGHIFVSHSAGSSAGNPDRTFTRAIAGAPNTASIFFPTGTLDETHITAAFSPADYGLRVWSSKDDATGNQDIFAEMATPGSLGANLKGAFLVNTDQTVGNQFQPQAAAIGEGRFIVAWIDGNSQRVRATLLDTGGNVDVPPFDVSFGVAVTHNSGDFELGLTVLANGNTVIAYRLNSSDTVFRIVSPNGNVLGGEIDYDGIAGGTGAPDVVALADGRFAIVTLDLSIFLHLSKIYVKEGDFVKAGQVIGAVGATGAVTGPHLHWGLYVNGEAIDPVAWRYEGLD